MSFTVSSATVATPSTFQWWADIWIPAGSGIATLAVAVMAILIAYRSYKLEAEARRAEANRLHRAAREEIAGLLSAYMSAASVDYELSVSRGSSPREWGNLEWHELITRAKLLGDVKMSEAAWRAKLQFEARPPTGDARDKVYAVIEQSRIEGRVNQWVQDPAFSVKHGPWEGEQRLDWIMKTQMADWDGQSNTWRHSELFWFLATEPGMPPR